jgi:hypothetical protein
MQLMQGSTGTAADTRFDSTASAGFDTSPLNTANFSNNNQTLDLTGGTINNGDTWTPGQGPDGGELVINAIPVAGGPSLRTFVLKEQPGIGGPPVAIPIPAAAWTGMSGLFGLGVFSILRRVRQHLAI